MRSYKIEYLDIIQGRTAAEFCRRENFSEIYDTGIKGVKYFNKNYDNSDWIIVQIIDITYHRELG